MLIGGMQTPDGLKAIQELVRAALCCWRCFVNRWWLRASLVCRRRRRCRFFMACGRPAAERTRSLEDNLRCTLLVWPSLLSSSNFLSVARACRWMSTFPDSSTRRVDLRKKMLATLVDEVISRRVVFFLLALCFVRLFLRNGRLTCMRTGCPRTGSSPPTRGPPSCPSSSPTVSRKKESRARVLGRGRSVATPLSAVFSAA